MAVLRHQYYAIPLLLDAGIPADVKVCRGVLLAEQHCMACCPPPRTPPLCSQNARLWLAIDEAVALRDAQAAKMLYT